MTASESIAHIGSHASGVSNSECHVLIHRFRTAERRKDVAESWLFEHSDGMIYNRSGLDIYLGALWRSPSGVAFVAGQELIERIEPRSAGGSVSCFEPPTRIDGLWGLSDDFVVAWGADPETWGGGLKPEQRVDKMFVYDGRTWTDMPAPALRPHGGYVNAVRGRAKDDLVAVGDGGLITRWDGREWRQEDVPFEADFTGLHVASATETYACAPSGLIVKGSADGWTEVLSTTEFETRDIATFADRVWVAGGDAGLLELLDDRLVVVKDNIPALRLETGETLLAMCEHVVASTPDGESFTGTFFHKLPNLIEEARAEWFS